MNELLKPGKVFPRAGNPLWPLPPDYMDRGVSEDYRRLARVNACRMFTGPDEVVASWSFFKHWYLEPDPESGFDPGFYSPPFKDSPPLHYSLVRNWWNYEYMALCWPRGFAKTTTKQSMFLWLACVAHGYKVLSVLATDDFCTKEMSFLKTQLMENPRILEDFGDLRGKRGSRIWNNHDIELTNGFCLAARSIEGRKRGIRAHWIVPDDCERDERTDEGVTNARAMKRKELTHILIPMMRPGSKITYIGTIILQSLLHRILIEDESDPDTMGRFKSLERGGHWFKQHIGAFDGKGNTLWGSMYSLEHLAQKRAVMGEAAFQTEMLNLPRSEEEPLFNIQAPKHEYVVEGQDPSSVEDPFQATGTVRWHDSEGKEVRQGARDWLLGMYRVTLVDYAYALRADSDFCAVVTCGVDSRGCVWVLDAWQGKVPSARLADITFQIARKWRSMTIGVEAVAAQIEVYERVKDYFEARTQSEDWGPSVFPIKYPAGVSKESRIAGLEPRFVRGLLKFPGHRRMEGVFVEFYRQVLGFTGEPRALSHDDLIDALSMIRSVARGGGPRGSDPVEVPRTVEEMLAAGETTIPGTSVSLAGLVSASQLQNGRGDAILDIARQRRDAQLIEEGQWSELNLPIPEVDEWLNQVPPADESGLPNFTTML